MTHLPGYSEMVLLVGNKQGDLHLYDNIEGNLDGSFNLVSNNYSNIKTGRRSTVAGYDVNNDGVLELAIGQYRGGMTIYDTASYDPTWWDPCVGISEIKFKRNTLRAFPNPSNDVIYLQTENSFGKNDLVETFDALGRKSLMIYKYIDERTIMIDVKDLHDGIYKTQVLTSPSVQPSHWMKLK